MIDGAPIQTLERADRDALAELAQWPVACGLTPVRFLPLIAKGLAFRWRNAVTITTAGREVAERVG